MKNEEKAQEKYIEMKVLEEQLEEMQKKSQMVEKQLMELMSTVQSLDDFKKTNNGDEILVPISSGIFIKANIKENNEFLVNVGAETVVTKDIESTKKLMSKQVEEMTEFNTRINMQMQKMAMKASVLQNELKELIKESE
ncbi:MAG: prefoldin subunit alpha [Nanoarchaeota archaeon]|nr:prefoldin subunit alpha [Nanoarchaeota archaeon]MBU1004521.1 prefoldin subunit alpha [Nanoarchaeota archaeon]MBU1945942.1 prefoldin subunit alpha [Nanoarchaeota archaeon]